MMMAKRDKRINGRTSASFAADCKDQTLTYQERLDFVNNLLDDDYWEIYFRDYNDVKGTAKDYIAEQSHVEMNIEKMANYLLQASDSDELINKKREEEGRELLLPKQVKYRLFQDRDKFEQHLATEHHNMTEEGIAVFVSQQQHIKEKNFIFKPSMLRLEGTKEYADFYRFAINKDNMRVVRARLIEAKDSLVSRNEEIQIKLKTELHYLDRSGLEIEYRDNLSSINWCIGKIKTLVYYFSNIRNYIKEDILEYDNSLRPVINFKKVENYLALPHIINLFDYIDIVDDFADHSKLKMMCRVGGIYERENCIEELLFTNSVYEPKEAMLKISALISYYASEVIENEEHKIIFGYYRSGFSEREIAEKVVEIKIMSKQNVNEIINRIINNIADLHKKNVDYFYELNIIRDTTNRKTCTSCKESKPKMEFGKDSRNKEGLKSVCKACDKESKRQKRLENMINGLDGEF